MTRTSLGSHGSQQGCGEVNVYCVSGGIYRFFSGYSKVTFMSVCVYRFLSGSLGFFWVSVGVYCFCLVSLGLLWNSKGLSQKIFFGSSVDFSFYLYHVVIIT